MHGICQKEGSTSQIGKGEAGGKGSGVRWRGRFRWHLLAVWDVQSRSEIQRTRFGRGERDLSQARKGS